MVIDSGNPRYAASKHSSFLGGLTTGQHVKNRFKVPVDAYRPITRTQVDEELFGAEGSMYNTLNCTSKTTGQYVDEDDNNGIIRPDELLYNDQEDKFFARMRGASREQAHTTDPETATVATSAVYGQIEDAGSSVPTAFYTQKISDYSKRLEKEQKIREVLENKVKKLQREVKDKSALHNSKLLDMALSSDKLQKLAIIDQRNCMPTGQNYGTHPQFEYL